MGLRALRSRRLHRAAWLEVFATLSARDRGRYGGVVPLEALRQFRREILDLAARHGARNVRVFGSVGDVCGRRRRPHRRPRRASGIRIDGVRTERPLTACHCRPASSRPRGERGAESFSSAAFERASRASRTCGRRFSPAAMPRRNIRFKPRRASSSRWNSCRTSPSRRFVFQESTAMLSPSCAAASASIRRRRRAGCSIPSRRSSASRARSSSRARRRCDSSISPRGAAADRVDLPCEFTGTAFFNSLLKRQAESDLSRSRRCDARNLAEVGRHDVQDRVVVLRPVENVE